MKQQRIMDEAASKGTAGTESYYDHQRAQKIDQVLNY